jgi:hypothetical protein
MEFLTNNWWAAFKSVAFPSPQAPAGPAPAQATVASYPSFLSAGERKAADREWLKFSAIDAPEFLCREALRHARFYIRATRAHNCISSRYMRLLRLSRRFRPL